VLLNDPVYLEAARLVGERISGAPDPSAGIQEAFRCLTGRRARAEELEVLLELQQQEVDKFRQHPEKMQGWLQTGAAEKNDDLPEITLAANTVVASTILNSDAAIVKR
jgi:hypothetical protein